MKLNRLLVIGILASAIAACSTTEPPQPKVQEVITINETSYYNSIWFDNDSTVISSDFDAVINLNAAYLKSNPVAIVQIQGNASEIGSKEANQKLSVTRAKVVATRLISLGVSPHQIQEVAFGSNKPTFASDKKGHSPKNRRADIIYISGAPVPYYIEQLPVVSTEDETVEFDPISIKGQKQKYKAANSSAPTSTLPEAETAAFSTPENESPAPMIVTPTTAAPDASAPATMGALPADQGM